MIADLDLVDQCRHRVAQLCADRADTSPPRHVPSGSTRADHALTTSALVYCLAFEHPARELLRLAALTHDMPDADDRDPLEVRQWRMMLQQHGAVLDAGRTPDLSGLDPAAQLLAQAHLAASERQPIDRAAAFATHPLSSAGSLDLVYGGAVKVKSYVFGSAKLPEIRGASVLLDGINQIDLPALWGREPEYLPDSDLRAARLKRYDAVREWFRKTGEPLDAPECVLYASGGNILALAPHGHGARFARAIEQRYTAATQIAHSVGVAQSFALLELQYGRAPQQTWTDQLAALAQDPAAAQLLRQSYGLAADEPITAIVAHKGFGELVTLMTKLADRRRLGDPDRPVIHVEYDGQTARCTSCDARPALAEGGVRDEQLCEPCLIKRKAGMFAKKGDLSPEERRALTDADRELYGWLRPWATWLYRQTGVDVQRSANDLHDIARRSANFVGLVYADGNDVGNAVAQLKTIGEYRSFAAHMLHENERAVAAALAGLVQEGVAPFEIITVGGDDVLVFVPATQALSVALQLAQAFDTAMQPHKITISAGVLLMPEHTPIRFAQEHLVEPLLKSAKKRAKQHRRDRRAESRSDPAPSISALDFLALKAVPMIIEGHEQYVKNTFGSGDIRLTQRPYTLDELALLLAACRHIREARFPRSQLYQLREVIEDGDLLRAAIDYRYFVERGKRRQGTSTAYARFDQAMRSLCGGDTWLPWRFNQQMQVYDTPLLDLIDLLPFVEEAQRG